MIDLLNAATEWTALALLLLMSAGSLAGGMISVLWVAVLMATDLRGRR